MRVVASSTMVEVLTEVWQRLFERSSISTEENFFDLGGDPSLAVRLFQEIARISGRDLPPMLIYQAPTIAALAGLLEGRRNALTFSPLVPLSNGTEDPPVFFAHGLGGSVMELFHLVKHIPLPLRIYGMQAPGLDGVSKTPESIQEMAELYIAAIKRVQPSGPYSLVGYSLGGLLALEMAHQLSLNGDSIGLLTMIDSFPHLSHLSAKRRLRLKGKLAVRRVSRRLLQPRGIAPSETYRPAVDASFAPAMQEVLDCSAVAWRRYCPRYYAGTIHFIRAADNSMFPDNPVPVWAHLAEKFEMETVPGDHLSLLTTNAGSLGCAVTRLLKGTARA